MKTLILCVDRDDDVGVKGGVKTPVVGRRRNLEAAMALGLADPEDSDTNALLAAVKLYDDELKAGVGAEQVEVATVTGHPKLGLQADRKLSRELEEVLAAVHPDEVILVSDGAEDEQILPLLTSRAKLSHVHRSIVKQAPRLEGAYYVITRLLDDEKQAKRFVLPVALILLIWGIAYLLGLAAYAAGATLALLGAWLLVHAMKWERRVGGFFQDIAKAVRAGKLGVLANALLLGLLVAGILIALRAVKDHVTPANVVITYPTLLETAVFLQAFLPYFVGALLVRTAGGLLDSWARGGKAGLGHWTAAFLLIALGFIGSVVLDASVERLEGADLLHVVTQERIVQFAGGLAVLLTGIVIGRYVRSSRVAPS
jgi:putative membrane protein